MAPGSVRAAWTRKRRASGSAGPRHIAKIGDIAAAAGLRRIHMLAWRDVADVEAGGSELHAATVARLWAEAGIEVTMRTSYAQGAPPESVRNGYRVIRRGGPVYGVSPGRRRRDWPAATASATALVEIWNGVPWFTPLWARGPKVTWLHHIHGRHVGHGAAAQPGPRRRACSSGGSRRRSTGASASSHCPSRRGASSWAASASAPTGCRWCRRASTPGSSPVVSASGRPSWSPSAGSCPSSASTRSSMRDGDGAPARSRAELVIVGEGAERERLEELVEQLDATEWVRWRAGWPTTSSCALYRRAWLVAAHRPPRAGA